MEKRAASPSPSTPYQIPSIPVRLAFLVVFTLAVETPVFGANSHPRPPPVSSATDVIRLLDRTLVASMKIGSQAGFRGRYRLLAPVIRRTIAWRTMLHLLTGQEWSELSAAQQIRLRHLFIRYTIANYAHNFRSYDGQHFQIMGHRHNPAYHLVIARLNEKSHRYHTFVYLLQKTGSLWRVVNIFVDGVSDVILLHSQFQFVLKKKGPEGLFDYLKQSIRRFETPVSHPQRNHAP